MRKPNARRRSDMPPQFWASQEGLMSFLFAQAGQGPAADQGVRHQCSHRALAQWPRVFSRCPFHFFCAIYVEAARPACAASGTPGLHAAGTTFTGVANGSPPAAHEPLFDRIFAEQCSAKAVFMGYRTEYLRRQMLDDLRRSATTRNCGA